METKHPLALTFDDVLLYPGHSDFDREEINVRTQLTRTISLESPFVSAPMDTVTEDALATRLGALGGIGIIHRNLPIDEQAGQVAKVKASGQLVGAAIGSSAGFEARLEALMAETPDTILVDSAHGNAKRVISTLRFIKKHYDIDVIAGNVATRAGARALIDAGADALRVGMGPGAICSTRIISGMGVPQLTAIMETSRVARKAGVPVIADGGITYSGDVTKALAAGASTVMMGRMFAATEEAPGEVTELPPEQVPDRFRSILNGSTSYRFKAYRGMGSIGAMQRGAAISSEDEFHGKNYQSGLLIAEGVEGLVPCSGSLETMIGQLEGGLRSGMYYVGAKNIAKLHKRARFMQITIASLTESHPHNLFVTDGGGNY